VLSFSSKETQNNAAASHAELNTVDSQVAWRQLAGQQPGNAWQVSVKP
jgi:hypothetical protein